jgi:hypothetical protein
MKRVQYFNWVRDIPYRLPLSVDEPDYCCFGKHQILERLLKGAGLEVRPRICDSNWSQFAIPKRILALPHEDEIYHVWLEVKIHGKWRQIDASLDKGLSKRFPLIEWDGENNTELCVVPQGKIYSPKQSFEIYHETVENDFSDEAEFCKALNEWLESLRTK